MERLWIREVRRAARRASAPFARQVALGCGAAAVGMPDKVIRCRFDLNHEVFPSGFYDVRWFRADDRSKLVEITIERFQLRNHSIGRRTGSVPRSNPRLAPKALPISEDEIKPRRLAPKAVPSEDEIKPRRAVEAR
jgi:hypothetical protein